MNRKELSELVKQCVREVMSETEGQATEDQEKSLADLQKKLKGFNSLLAKVPADVKDKVKAKIKQIEKQIEDYTLQNAGSDEKAKSQATKDLAK